MLEFKPLKLEDKELFEQYSKIYDTITCHYSFHSLYAWKDYFDVELAFYMDALYIKMSVDIYSDPLFYLPICEKNLDIHLENLKEYCLNNDYKFILTNLEEKMKTRLEQVSDEFRYEDILSNSDYIYLKDDLKSLSGKKLKNKRNFVNQFKNNYSANYSYEVLSDLVINDVLAFMDQFNRDDTNESFESLAHEKVAAKLLLDNWQYLKLLGGILKIDNEIVAFCLASFHPNSPNTVVVHIERANHRFIGASQMINYLFANHLDDTIKYINREEDLGVLGIRKAKISYNPIFMGTSYNAYHKSLFDYATATDEDENHVKKLYYNSFGEDKFANYYFDNIYDKDNTFLSILCHRLGSHRDISMATKISLTLNNDENISYLFALATKPRFRKQGIMKNLLNNIPYNDVILIPENDQVLNFYKHLDFKTHTRGYINTFHTSSLNSVADIRVLTPKDIKDIDELYNKTYELNIKRDKIYPYIFEFYEVHGYFVDNTLIAYAFLDKDTMFIAEVVSSDISKVKILVENILNEYNLDQIDCFNSFIGTEIYYFYKGNISPKLFVNILYD